MWLLQELKKNDYAITQKEIGDIIKENNGAIDISVRSKYKSFADIMYSVRKYLERYYHELNIEELDITKDYLFTKEKIRN